MINKHDNERVAAPADGISRRTAIRWQVGGLAAVAATLAGVEAGMDRPVKAIPSSQSVGDAFAGTWTYRSFVNEPTPNVAFNSLRFGEAELVIDPFDPGSFSGRLNFGPADHLALAGASSFGNPFTVRFQGVGEGPSVQGWVYDYVGYLVPPWPSGLNQRPAIVGSAVRTVEHDGAAAGLVASWIAVKQD